jgi:3,4-dihydroxy 2-butanone 4-phosphate synthase/GTP cyclohydrolase II
VKIGTIADLIRYRMQNEKSVERVADAMMTTEFGPFRVLSYQDVVGRQVHFALVKGEIHPSEPVMVRVHVQHLLSDLLALRLPDSGWPLRDALQRVAREPSGVLVFLSRPEDPAALIRRMRSYQFGSTETPRTADQSTELRTYGIGAQILLDIGVRRMQVLGAPKRLTGLSGFNLEIVEYVS